MPADIDVWYIVNQESVCADGALESSAHFGLLSGESFLLHLKSASHFEIVSFCLCSRLSLSELLLSKYLLPSFGRLGSYPCQSYPLILVCLAPAHRVLWLILKGVIIENDIHKRVAYLKR